MKPTPWSAKFPRNPKYTPATLTDAELTRVERIARVRFNRAYQPGESSYDNRDFGYLAADFYRKLTGNHPRVQISSIIRSNPEAERYLISCLNYLMAIARNNGWLTEYRESNKKWAMASGYYA